MRIDIQTTNDAFMPDPCMETARILRELADRLEGGDFPNHYIVLRDSNGNRVGVCRDDEAEDDN